VFVKLNVPTYKVKEQVAGIVVIWQDDIGDVEKMTPVGKVIFRISPLVILWLLRNN
jgi:hypothetical protein